MIEQEYKEGFKLTTADGQVHEVGAGKQMVPEEVASSAYAREHLVDAPAGNPRLIPYGAPGYFEAAFEHRDQGGTLRTPTPEIVQETDATQDLREAAIVDAEALANASTLNGVSPPGSVVTADPNAAEDEGGDDNAAKTSKRVKVT